MYLLLIIIYLAILKRSLLFHHLESLSDASCYLKINVLALYTHASTSAVCLTTSLFSGFEKVRPTGS